MLHSDRRDRETRMPARAFEHVDIDGVAGVHGQQVGEFVGEHDAALREHEAPSRSIIERAEMRSRPKPRNPEPLREVSIRKACRPINDRLHPANSGTMSDLTMRVSSALIYKSDTHLVAIALETETVDQLVAGV